MKSALKKVSDVAVETNDRMPSARVAVRYASVDRSDPTFHKYLIFATVIEIMAKKTQLFNLLPIVEIAADGITVTCPPPKPSRLAKVKPKFPRPEGVSDEEYTAALNEALSGTLTIKVGQEVMIRPDTDAAKDTMPNRGDIVVLRGLGAQFYLNPDKTKVGLAQIAEKHSLLTYSLPIEETSDGTISPISILMKEADTLPRPFGQVYPFIRDGLLQTLEQHEVPTPYPEDVDGVVRFASEHLAPETFMTTLAHLKAAAQEVVSATWAEDSGDTQMQRVHSIALHVRPENPRWKFVVPECKPTRSYGQGREYVALGLVLAATDDGPCDLLNRVAFTRYDAPDSFFGITRRETWELLHPYLVHAGLPLSICGDVDLGESSTSIDLLTCKARAIAYAYRDLVLTYGLFLPDPTARLALFKPDPEVKEGDKKEAGKVRARLDTLRRIAAESGVFFVVADSKDAVMREIGVRAGRWFVLPRIMTTDAEQLMEQFDKPTPAEAMAELFARMSAFAARTRANDPAVYKDGRHVIGAQAGLFQAVASETQLLAFVTNDEPVYNAALHDVVKMQWTRDYQERAPPQNAKRPRGAAEQPPAKAAAIEPAQ